MNEQDKRVRDYYENMSLPQDKLELLLKYEASESSNSQHNVSESAAGSRVSLRQRLSRISLSHFSLSQRQWLPVGFACVLVLLTSLWMHESSNESERMQRTVREVAMNHTTRLEPEYYGETLAMLDNSMQQLPFTLQLPESIDKAYQLVGSRYCSLGGVLAAHVRLKSLGSGKPMSLFVTSNSAQLEDVRSQQTTLEGVDVEFWREGGLFYALAQRS